MAITVTHAKTVNIADDPKAAAAGEVLPSDWNAAHVVSGSTGRTVLAANTTFFVSTTGSDSNNGLTSGTAWATIQHAFDFVGQNIDGGGFTITIQVADGTYSAATMQSYPPNTMRVILQGNATTPSNVIVQANTTVFAAISIDASYSVVVVRNLLAQVNDIGVDGVGVGDAAVANGIPVAASVQFDKVWFTSTVNAANACVGVLASLCEVFWSSGGGATQTQITGNWVAGLFILNGPTDTAGTATGNFTFTGAPSFSTGFIATDTSIATEAQITFANGLTVTGAVTGPLASLANFSTLTGTITGWLGGTPVISGAFYQSVWYPKPVTFANLPASPSQGVVVPITDGLAANCGDGTCATWGTAVTGGGGALKLTLHYNGTGWTLIGK